MVSSPANGKPVQNGTTEEYDFDIFSIGGGTGGVRAARWSATNFGARSAVCEVPFDYIASETQGGLGGTCVLRGCVPKKLLSYGGEFINEFKAAEGYGWSLNGKPTHDWGRFMATKRKELKRLNDIHSNMLEKAGVKMIEGRGKIVDPHTVSVQGKKYTSKFILIATGGTPAVPNIEGKDLCVISDAVLDTMKRPDKMVIVGAGYIACEQACIFNNFGTEVHMLYMEDVALQGFDLECRKHVEEEYQRQGIHMYPTFCPQKVQKDPDGHLTVVARDPQGKEMALTGMDTVLMATGRTPNSKGLGLEEVGVELEKNGSVKVDEENRTTVPSIYAIGDVCTKLPLTPVARMEGTHLARRLFGGQKILSDYTYIPSVVFSSPHVAKVGLDEDQAVETYGDIRVYSNTFRPLKDTLSGHEGKGLMKVVVNDHNDKVVGIHLVGAEVAEILQGFAVAMKAGLTKTELDDTVGIHPSSAEELTTLRDPVRLYKDKKEVKINK
ncbi:hypothetical protein ABBQ32_004819 [Trebouxia sp. C0010 RCD-2024]